ncbi:MAG: S1/P1 nuclease [Bdellovibrionales bacterium]|nr:S1/P1 nuclease [Bdellovibrionales bacterium]
MKLHSNTKRLKAITIISTLTLFCSINSFGWGDLGHETTAEIAERLLAEDPRTMTAIRNIIGIEPLALSSTWPDKVRDDERFNDFSPYHFYTIFRDPKTFSEKNAMTVLEKYPNVLTDKKAPQAAKMIALRYIIHVVADIHQPLHVGNEFDFGGNLCKVRIESSNSSNGSGATHKDTKSDQTLNISNLPNLHSTWDTALVNIVADRIKSQSEKQIKYFGYKQMAPSLMTKYKDLISAQSNSTTKANRGGVDVTSWIHESARLRETVVYPDQLPDDARPYCLKNSRDIQIQNVPVLNSEYMSRSADLVEQRLVLGGVRLANMLKKIFSQSRRATPTENDILNLLKMTSDVH